MQPEVIRLGPSPTSSCAAQPGDLLLSFGYGTATTTFVYDAFGKLAAEYGGAPAPSGRQYLTTDHLGSTRLVTNASGGDERCSDYLPFGEEIQPAANGRGACYATSIEPRQKFTCT